jgi:gluconolactonase
MRRVDVKFRQIADGLKFPEGPVALGDGSVVVVEIPTGLLWRIWPNGSKEVLADVGGGPNGAAVGPDGKIYVCQNGGFDWTPRSRLGLQPPDYTGGSIQRVDLDTRAVEVLYTHGGDIPIRSPNDIVFDDHGGFWFTDYGKEREREMDVTGVFYAKADGSLCREAIFPMNRANGIGLSPDGKKLYVTETYTARLWQFDVESPGVVKIPENPEPHGPHVYFGHHGKLLACPGGLRVFDSLAVDREGNICVGTLIDGGITVVSPAGDYYHVPLPDAAVTNICFGGPHMSTAFITMSASGRVIAADWPTPGLPLIHQK